MISRDKISPFTKTLDQEERRWFALRVRPKSEKMVGAQLLKKGVPTYVPVQKKVRYYTRKVKKVELPLIKGYVLVHMILEDYIKVLDTEHAIGFVRNEKAPSPIPEEAIDLLRRVEGSAHHADAVPLDQLQLGVELEIIGGELTGMQGRLCDIKGKEFVSIELIHMDTAIILDIDRKYLRLM